jgi:Zn-dependent protease with chaperone function
MPPSILHGLKAADYEHPKDAKALNTLENTKGIKKVTKKFYDMGIERLIKLEYTGSGIKATRKSFPVLFKALETACDVLNAGVLPELYIQRSEDLQATTLGVEHPIVVLTSESVNNLSYEELLFLMGKEVAHIQSNHVLYKEIGFIFPQLIDTLSYVTFGLSGIISGGLRYALFYWAQMAEYTADRGGLLACQDTYVAKQMFAKMAGLPEKHWATYDISEFEAQAREFEGFNEKTFDKFMRFIYGNNLWAIARAHELITWVEAGDYQRLLTSKTTYGWVE